MYLGGCFGMLHIAHGDSTANSASRSTGKRTGGLVASQVCHDAALVWLTRTILRPYSTL